MVKLASANSSRQPGCRCSGFSLLELLVAMTVLSVLLVILLSMVDGATSLWRASERRVDSFREARAALNMITRDLQSLYAGPDEKYIKVATTDGEVGQLVASPATGDIGDALFFLTTLNPDSQPMSGNDLAKSDLSAVGYYLAWGRPTTTGDFSFNLYRHLINSDDTFTALESGTDPLLDSGSQASLPPGSSELLARNIVRFEVTPYSIVLDADGNPTGGPVPFTQSATTPFPDLLDIVIVAVNEDTASRWGSANQAAWLDDSTPLYKANARTFTARVHLPGAVRSNRFAQASPTPSPSPTP